MKIICIELDADRGEQQYIYTDVIAMTIDRDAMELVMYFSKGNLKRVPLDSVHTIFEELVK